MTNWSWLILCEIEMGFVAVFLFCNHKFAEAAIACLLVPVIEELRRLKRRQK